MPGIVGNWEEDDTPLGEHRRLYPHCPFVRNKPTANISLGQSCILDQIIPIPETEKEEEGIPYYRRYITFEARRESFKNERSLKAWPPEIQQRLTIHDLAEAGFNYFGLLDMVRCFSCGIGLHNWEENDDEEPWNVHARWSSSCEFLLLKKKADFIKKVQDQTPPYQQSNSAVKPQKNYRVQDQTPPYQQSNSAIKTQKIYRVNLSDDDMTYLMNTDSIIKVVIASGFPFNNVRRTLYKRLEERGVRVPFDNIEQCTEAVLEIMETEISELRV
ncbi:death-associated inhibitor of apoptosis 2-like 1 [Homarus americanus]|uniref:Death-associated inhibitor of apoptosis 2-like 1 n=1 Tax=Homarus americanus TaxID=6706 RepID=A0A8J5JZF2_HOMAM|nr:death-associated inhibitor of apoptosis 2-like 1 [Homarus americanus]